MSWLSSNLTGGLSSISNFTGQLSSFTREMLTEGTEEVSDPSAELKVAQVHINELEARLLTQKSEYERLKQNSEELQVRLEASELQISNISKEYRMQLQNKEQELIKLRELSRIHEEQGHTLGRRERCDSTDSIEDSIESKGLRSEISRLQTECQHWKSLANGMENQDRHREIDQYQQELVVLQSSYSQKISNLNKRHKQEVQKWQEEKEDYIQRIEELEELLQAENKQGRGTHDLSEDRNEEEVTVRREGELTCRNEGEGTCSLSLRNELDLAKKHMIELRNQVKIQEDDITFLNTELEEKKDALTKAQTSLMDTEEKLRELSVSDQEMIASKDALNDCYKRIETLENQLQEQNRELETHKGDAENLRTLHQEFDFLSQQNFELKEQLYHSQSEERRMCRSVEEVKSELEQLSCSTVELMEELQISQGLQKEQMIEIESLKNVRYVKGEAKVEVAKLRSALAALWERHLNLVQLYQQVRHELHNSNARLMAMFQAQHSSTHAVTDDLNELQHRLAKRGEAKLETVVREKEAMMGHSAELRVTVEELEGAVMDLQSDNEQLAQEAKDCVVVIGRQLDTDEVDEGGDIVTSLQAEKAVLESTIVGLEKKVQDLQEYVITLQKQKPWRNNNELIEDQPSRSGSAESVSSWTEGTPQESKSSIDVGDFRRDSDVAEPEVRRESEASLEGSYVPEEGVLPDQQLSDFELRRQLEEYQQQVEEFELVRRDWEGEKEALEGLVLDLRHQVKEQQVKLASLVEEHSTSQAAYAEQLSVLQEETRQILSEKTNLLEAWKTIEEDFVTLDISSPRGDKDFEEPAIQRINSLRSDLKTWVLNRSGHVPSTPVESPSNVESGNRHVTDETQTDESIFLLRNTLDDFEKDNSLLRQQTERLIQEIEERTSKMTALQIELETKSVDLKGLSEEKRNLMVMINERDERIGELEESFNTHVLELTTSKDNEVNLLETEKEDLVKLLEENRQESALLRNKNNELLDFMGQNQQANDELREQNVSLASVLAKKEADLEVSMGDNNKLLSTLQDKDQLNASLTAENKSLLMEKEVLQTLVEEYKEKFDVQKHENVNSVKLKEEIECLNEKIQSSEKGWKELKREQVVVYQENERLQVELGQRQTEIDNMNLELNEKISQIRNLADVNEKLNGVVRDQISAFKDLEQKLADTTKKAEDLKDSLGIKDVEVDKLELDLREKGAENDLLWLDIAKLSRQVKEKEELIHTQVLDSSAPGTDEVQSRLADLMRLLVFKDQEIAALKQKDASLVELVSQTDRSSHQAHEEYELRIQQVVEERDRLLADLSLRDEELLTVQDRLDAMREKMQSKDQASHLLNAEHARLLSLNETQAKEMGRLRERYSSLQKLLEERERGKSAEAQRVHDENEQLKRKIGTLKVEHETLTTLVHEKDKQIATLALLGSPASPVPSPHGTDVDQQQIKRLREERDVLIRERDSVHREKESKEQQISAMQEEVYTLKQTVEQKTSLAVKLAAKSEELGKQIADLHSQIETLKIEKSNSAGKDNRIIQLEEEIRSIRGILDSKDDELKQVLERNRNEKTSILVELDNVRSERDDILEQKDTETNELKNKLLQLAHALTDSDRWREESVNAQDIDRNFQTLIYTVKNQRNTVLRERDNEIRSLREQLSNMTLLTKSSKAHDSGLEEVLREKEELHRMLLQTRDEKEDLLREKELIVADLQEQVISLSRIVSDKERASQQDLERVIHDKERIVKELDQARRDWDEVNRVGSRWQAEVSRLQSELHEVNGVLTKERDFVTNLRQEIGEVKMAVHEKERIVKELMVEREQLQRTGEQLQRRVQELQEELTTASSGRKEAEAKKVQELERLRNHLVQVEESYTREALEAEEREKDLRIKIARAEEQLMSSSHSMLDRHRQASVQIESLNEQLQALAVQRDHAVLELASAQEQAHQYQTSLTNLQLVLEQFQRERESQLKGTQEQAQRDIQRAWAEVKALQQRENQLKSQLEMAARVTQEVVNLRDQLNLKQEELQQQTQEVTRLEEELRVGQERIKNLNSLSDNKVEKSLLRNLLMGYFTTPENKRAEVLRVIGGLLGFTHEELDKVGTGSSAPKTSSWISSFNPFAHTPPKTPTQTTTPGRHQVNVDKSFSELFVSFLESESEVRRSSTGGGTQSIVTNPLLSGLTPHPSTVMHPSLPGSGRPMATSTPISTPLRNNLPTAPPPSLSRSLVGAVPNAMDGARRPSNTSTNANPLLAGSLAPAQELPALSSSNSLRTVLEGRS